MIGKRKRVLSLLLALFMGLTLLPAAALAANDAAEETTRIDILTFADFHGRLEFDPLSNADPGAARFVSYIEYIRAQNPNPDNVVIIPGGDDFHGGPLSNLFRGEPTLDMMRYLGIDYMAFGNHEFSFGEATARTLGRGPENDGVTFLAADLFYGAAHPNAVANPALVGTRPDFVQPYTTLTFEQEDGEEIVIGLVGIMNPHMNTLVAGGMAVWETRSPVPRWPAGLPIEGAPNDGLIPPADPAYTQAIADIIETLREDYEVNAVVAVTHIGGGPRYYPIMNFLADNLDFDAIVGGHEHGRFERVRNDVPIVVGGWHGRTLGKVSLSFENGTLVDATGWLSPEGAVRAFDDHDDFDDFRSYHDDILEMLAEWEAQGAEVFGPQGPYGVYIGDGIAYRNAWVTRVFHDYIVRWSEEHHDEEDGPWVNDWVTVTNGGGWRNNAQWPMAADDMVYGRTLISTMPFDDAILWVNMYGEDLLKLLAHGGVNTGLHRVGNDWFITATGEQVKDDQSTIHNVAVRGFMYSGYGASGGDGFPLPGNNQGNALGMTFHGHPRVITTDGSDLRHNDMIAETRESAAWAGLGAVMIRDMLIESTRFRGETPNEEWQSEVTVTAEEGGTAAITSPYAPGDRSRTFVINPQWVTVEATPASGYAFVGWYADDELVSTARVFGFVQREDTALEARFEVSDFPFTDVPEDVWGWARDYIQFVYERGVMEGDGDGRFNPGGTFTRAMMATTLWREAGRPEVEWSPVFTDIPEDAADWYRTAVMWAYENNVVQGHGDGTFAPTAPITREQFAAMLARNAEFEVPEDFALDFPDADDVSPWAVDYMIWANYHDLIRGTGGGLLVPGGFTERAQAATILARFIVAFVD